MLIKGYVCLVFSLNQIFSSTWYFQLCVLGHYFEDTLIVTEVKSCDTGQHV